MRLDFLESRFIAVALDLELHFSRAAQDGYARLDEVGTRDTFASRRKTASRYSGGAGGRDE